MKAASDEFGRRLDPTAVSGGMQSVHPADSIFFPTNNGESLWRRSILDYACVEVAVLVHKVRTHFLCPGVYLDSESEAWSSCASCYRATSSWCTSTFRREACFSWTLCSGRKEACRSQRLQAYWRKWLRKLRQVLIEPCVLLYWKSCLCFGTYVSILPVVQVLGVVRVEFWAFGTISRVQLVSVRLQDASTPDGCIQLRCHDFAIRVVHEGWEGMDDATGWSSVCTPPARVSSLDSPSPSVVSAILCLAMPTPLTLLDLRCLLSSSQHPSSSTPANALRPSFWSTSPPLLRN